MCGFRFEDDNKLKPGILTHRYAIEYYFNKGLKAYDFMAGDQPYKYRMATDTEDVFFLTLTKKNLQFKVVNFCQKVKNIIKNKSKNDSLVIPDNAPLGG
jgi:CelD/BcsL family acetyltransferase involved in cellulose biosynthesis